MLNKLSFINRETMHFIMGPCLLVFGLASPHLMHVQPGAVGAPALAWWPTSYALLWVFLGFSFLGLVLLGRAVSLEGPLTHLPIFIALTAILLTIGSMFIAINYCRVAVFPDRVESRAITLHGPVFTTYQLSQVSSVQYGCAQRNARGALYAEVNYILNFPDADTVDLISGRNDGRDDGRWVPALSVVDASLMARNVPKSDINGRPGRPHDNSDCFAMLSKKRTPEEVATIERIFQPPVVPKKKKAKVADGK